MLPDIPRWAIAHGIAADPASWRAPLGAGFAVGSDRARLIVASPDADVAALRALAAAHATHAILLAPDLAADLGRARIHIVLHALAPDAEAPATLDGAALLAPDALAHLPPALAAELAAATTPIHAIYLDDRPVAFAYAPWRSARWFDVSVEVLPSARRLGLGTIVASACLHAEIALGRMPVWGAPADAHASLALAARLGFTAVDALTLVASRAPSERAH